MNFIRIILITAVLGLSAAFANNSFLLGLVIAGELDANGGCVAQEAVEAMGGYCWTLNSGVDTHRSLVNLVLNSYSDLTTIGPWYDGDGDGVLRFFSVDGDEVLYTIMLFGHGRGSAGAIVPAERP